MCVRPQPIGGTCGLHFTKVCASDAECIKNRCSKTVPLGGVCLNSYYVCEDGTTCDGKICSKTVGAGEKCEGKGISCAAGYECLGAHGLKTCEKPEIPLGGDCTLSGSVCETGLSCHEGVCSKTVGGGEKCEGLGIKCDTDFSCIGTSGYKVCKKLIDLGGQCSDPYWVCKDGLTCNGEICTKVIGGGEKCEADGLVCDTGYDCVGTVGFKVCKKLIDLGGQCSDPYWVCKDGLTCNGDICTKVIGGGEKCEADGLVCDTGYDCVGTVGSKVCKKLIDLGGQCSDPYWVCKDSLTCNGDICTKVVGGGEKCEADGLVCDTGYDCVGTVGFKVCKKSIDLGGQCSDPYWVCKDGLTCNGEICTKVVGYQEKCLLPKIVCEPGQGLGCVGNYKGYYCRKLMDEGGSCIDPWWQCKPDLVCKTEGHKKICRAH